MTAINENNGEAINAKEWSAAGKILDRAARLIEEKGWQQGAVEAVPQECIATALEHSFKEEEYSIVDFNYAREALSRVLQIPRDPIAVPGDPLDVPYWGRHLMEWNDTPGRTKTEVLESLQSAAGIALALSNKS
jgi:hypothetical protein